MKAERSNLYFLYLRLQPCYVKIRSEYCVYMMPCCVRIKLEYCDYMIMVTSKCSFCLISSKLWWCRGLDQNSRFSDGSV